jgi:phosphoenolpyruvate-protein phosphotransferase (PTS system enzyme I)
VVDGLRGRVVLSPGLAQRAAFYRDHAMASHQRTREDAARSGPVTTRDGAAIAVMITIAGPQDLHVIDPASCDGIGLFRTELMLRDGEPLPDEDQQYQAYRDCLEWADGKPVTIRTFDVGGDKPIRGLTITGESNPFLGSRGIRLMLARPDVFAVQLRALARAAVHGDLRVMLPMVTHPAEVDASNVLLDQAIADLKAAGVACGRPPLGIMVEVPAAAILAGRFGTAAFFSVGSNDLTQYVMAASRDTPAVAQFNEGAPEAVLLLISGTVAAARTRGIPVSLCGDLASDDAALAAVLATGLRSLSVAPAALGRVKHALANLTLDPVIPGDLNGRA